MYLRTLPIVTACALFLGLYFVVCGRPSDARGYAPSWWNLGYVVALAAAVVAALVVHAVWL
jgi:hypothetical protein